MTRKKVLKVVKDLPDNFELEDSFDRLLLIKRIERGVRQSQQGETLTEVEAKKHLGRWLTDAGTEVR